jgi:hypothetical protein
MRTVSQKQKDSEGKFCLGCGALKKESHHPLVYSGRQIDEITVGLCIKCHRGNNGTIFRDVKIKSELIAIGDNLEYLKTKYPKLDWVQRYKYLCLQNNKSKNF